MQPLQPAQSLRLSRALVLLTTGLLVPSERAEATFHNWEIVEVYSNADGSVQYIELFTTQPSQNQVGGQDIVVTTELGVTTFTFGEDIVGGTANHNLLITNEGYTALPGVASPDYQLDPLDGERFFDPGADNVSVNFVSADVITFPGSSLPANGPDSLHFTTAGVSSVAEADPTNFAGAVGSVSFFQDGFESGDLSAWSVPTLAMLPSRRAAGARPAANHGGSPSSRGSLVQATEPAVGVLSTPSSGSGCRFARPRS